MLKEEKHLYGISLNKESGFEGFKINISGEFIQKVLDRFEKEETVLTKNGERVMDSFRRLLRHQMGRKEDYTQLSTLEKIAEARERIMIDFKVASEEMKLRNPVEYLLDRALDPLDEMNVVYKEILKQAGASINDKRNVIRLSPKLNEILKSEKKGIQMQEHNIVTVLPVFKGYTIDARLKEFRRVEQDSESVYINFNSAKGKALLEELANNKPVPLVKISPGSELSGKFIGSFPVDWPLTNKAYAQAALKTKNQIVLVTLPINYLEKLSIGKVVTLRGTAQGIETVIPFPQQKNSVGIKPKHGIK